MTANDTQHPTAAAPEIDASCRVPLLALLVGASVWLVIGTVLALIASIKFHGPDFLADCPMLTYGRVIAAANDALIYGFCIPASLAVMLWIISRLSHVVFTLPLVPVVAAHIWHLGVLVGILSILGGHSTGFLWLEFPRYASVLLLVAFVLIAVPMAATFGFRLERTLHPSHWFFLAALLWFPWSYASANIFLVAMPVRGVAQAVIDLWFGNNLLFVWFGLVGLGVIFYLVPHLTGRPLNVYFYPLFVFWTLILFGAWCGIPPGSPFPAWIPSLSYFGSWLLVVPLLGVVVIAVQMLRGASSNYGPGGPLCFMKVGLLAFLISGLMLHLAACGEGISHTLEFTWFGQARVQLEIFGFLGMVLFGAIYYIMPRVTGAKFKISSSAHFWLYLIGLVLFVIPLAVGGYMQGAHGYNPDAALPCLKISTLGLTLILLGNLIFAVNILTMFLTWKITLAKSVFAAVLAPLKTSEVKS